MASTTVSVHVFAAVVSPAAVRVCQHGLRKTPVALSYVAFKNTCNNVVKLHVTIHCYITSFSLLRYIYVHD